ncbi:hypothetical protein C0V82_24970 (plasmid) [Niveispirillum cyanobacteriorum]|uniref:Uncharacterized protein n=2 Tax=Niveispirillum cyanobacteriorum TaxID=1612173 RepID=A0A2K9NKL7_9PROT|nr:hypothetical protein C0V82_24970 [Niveispirillum cyanobacteriorum]
MKLQNAVVDFRNTVRPEYEDYFDPYSEADIARVNAALNAAVGRGFEALNAVGSTRRMRSGTLAITVHYPDGSKPKAQQPSESDLEACKQGICARARDSLIIRLLLDGQVLGSKVVHPPSPGVMALPLPGSVSNQDIAIALNEGVVEKYDFKRDSALLQLVKLPGALISGVAKGLTQGLTDEKTALEAKKDLLTLEREMAAADKAESENNENGNPGSTPSADNANDQGRTSPANPGSDGESLHSAEASGGGVDGVPMGGGAGGAAPGNSSPIDLSQSPGTGVSAGPANALTIRPFSLDVPGFPVAVEAGQPQTQQGK